MGYFALQERRSASASPASMPEWAISAFGGGATSAGVAVDETTAISLTPVWAAIDIIADTMGIFPLHIFRNTGPTTKAWAQNHPQYNMLHGAPNENLTAFDWCHMMATYQLAYGAGISEIEFDANGHPVALWPIPTRQVTPAKTASGKLTYKVTDDKGAQRTLWPHQLLIFRFWPRPDGGWLSPITVHRETIGSALAVREFGARTFGQGTNPAGIITGIPPGLKEDAKKTLETNLANYRGLGKSHSIITLEGGLKFERVGLPPEDAQYLETRKFDTSEIARIYRVPLFLLQEHEKSTSWGSGISEMKEAFVIFTMLKYCIQWEQEINKKLLDGGNKFYCKFAIDGLLRGALKDRMQAYEIGSRMGIYSIDEMREMEDMNPLPNSEGDARLVPMNMGTLENIIAGKGENDAKQDS